jgi:hypothetical protein
MLLNPQPPITANFENTQGIFFTRKDLARINQLSTVQEKLTFHSLASKIQNGSFVVLGINGLDDTQRIHFSHWVTVAGVNIPQSQIALSDPYFDRAQATTDPTVHNDAAIVSHDIYTVNTTSPFPEEADYWWLEGYLSNLYSVIPAALIITPITENIPPIPPLSYFIKPDEHYFFINDQHIFSTLFGNTVVIGGITFEANAFSTEGIKSIEFFINDKLQVVDDSFPFEWFWNEPSFGRYIVKIIAVDTVGTRAENQMIVWKFF